MADDNRLVAVVHAMERAFPGLHLGWTISNEGRFLPLPRRDAWITEDTRKGAFPLICNDDESNLVTLSWSEPPTSQNPCGQRFLEVHAEWPLDATGLSVAAELLEQVAGCTHALWGHATPGRAAGDIAEQTSPTLEGPPYPPRSLPALKLPWDLPSPETPHRLGWLNYWSAAAAGAIGFPDHSRDEDLLSLARSTATDGWVVRLTTAPLDLDNPAHLDALLRGYDRFPKIGGRSSLRSPRDDRRKFPAGKLDGPLQWE
ncbi:DUF5953 family protein [Pyxidicoccus trucidator]|uniref:DUF5953 family protein n=1 Tax=Pyxidicoccus trucidator TaxID=2709662 RepID=UPI0030843639